MLLADMASTLRLFRCLVVGNGLRTGGQHGVDGLPCRLAVPVWTSRQDITEIVVNAVLQVGLMLLWVHADLRLVVIHLSTLPLLLDLGRVMVTGIGTRTAGFGGRTVNRLRIPATV